MVLTSLDAGQPGDKCEVRGNKHVVLHYFIAAGSSDLGQTLLGGWQARLTLLTLTLELQGYLAGEDIQWSLHLYSEAVN